MELCHEYKGRLIEPDFGAEGDVRLSALMRHMQQSGSDQLAALGITYDKMREHGEIFLMSCHELRRTQTPVSPGDIVVTTWPRMSRGVRFFRDYRVCDGEGRLLAECSTAWVLVKSATRRILRPSSSTIVKPMHCDLSVSFGDPGQLAMPGSLTQLRRLKVGRSLLDVNGHVNNAVYADFLLDCVSELCPGARIIGQVISFCGEALEGDELTLCAAGGGDRVYVAGRIGDRRCFEAAAFLAERKAQQPLCP